MANDISVRDAFKLVGEEAATSVAEGRKVKNLDKLSPSTSMVDFSRVVFGLEPARHHMLWYDAIERLLPEKKRVMIIAPPGSAKTTVAGVIYPAFRLGQDPTRHFLYYGSASLQAEKQSGAVRDIVQDATYQRVFPHVRRSRTKPWGASMWYLERPQAWDKDPSFWAIGIDGPSLGARGDELIFDDICDPENMNTSYTRKKVRDKVAGVAFSRQSGVGKDARMLAIMTRWHEDDIAQFFEQEGFYTIWMPALGYWEYVHGHEPIELETLGEFPQLSELEKGDALWPEQYPKDTYDSTRRSSPDIWLLEYQGLAVRAGGNQFTEEDFRWWGADEGLKKIDPYRVRGCFQIWDTASKKGDQNDFSVCQTWLWADDGYYMARCRQYKLEYPELVLMVEKEYNEPVSLPDADGQSIQFKTRNIWVESTGTNNGAAIADSLKRKRIPIQEDNPGASKEERGGAAVRLIRDKPFYWAYDESAYGGVSLNKRVFLEQHKGFPRGKHDDIVDVTSAAVERLSNFPVTDGTPQATHPRLSTTTDRPRLTVMGTRSSGRIRRGQFSRTRSQFGRSD